MSIGDENTNACVPPTAPDFNAGPNEWNFYHKQKAYYDAAMNEKPLDHGNAEVVPACKDGGQ